MKRTLLFIAFVLGAFSMNAQEDRDDYLPFVEKGKTWNIVYPDRNPIQQFDQYILRNEEVVKNEKTYVKMSVKLNNELEVYGVKYLREENLKVYFYDPNLEKEFLLFDYSLKTGDSFETYSYDSRKVVSYKVISVGICTECPGVRQTYYNQQADSTEISYRSLRKWTVCRTDNESIQKTWIEGVGSLEGPLANLYDDVLTIPYSLSYVFCIEPYLYLPFSFCNNGSNSCLHGGDLSTYSITYSGNWDTQYTYELEGDRLHVFGKAFFNGACDNYAYFIEEKTEDPLVRKLRFKTQEVGDLATGVYFCGFNFYVPGFDPSMNYIVVDNKGEEHPVINKTPQNKYRPFIEKGKVWKVGAIGSGNPVQWVEHLFFDGDTIIDGKSCKQMMRQRYVNPDNPDYAIISQYPSLSYMGAWYEEDTKVYFCNATNNQFKLMYDFSLGINDTLLIDNQSYVIGPKQSGGMKGFKGVYRDVFIGEDFYNITWLEGVGGIDGPTVNVYYGKEYWPFTLMSCTVGDEIIYLNDEYEDGATPAEARKKRFDFTHTIKIRPKAPIKQERSDACISSSEREVSRPKVKAPSRSDEQLSLYGEYNNLQLGIHLEPLDEAYQVSIADESGKVVYEKAVNAGNIVGLSIDISAYAKGHYTVTVENSSEAFTGEFEAQTTGIEENVKIEKCKNVSIYNLQGQRLNSLQKGLNIVNGNKVVIK